MTFRTLEKCLGKYGKAFSPDEGELLRKTAGDFLADGLNPLDASVRAVTEILKIHRENLAAVKAFYEKNPKGGQQKPAAPKSAPAPKPAPAPAPQPAPAPAPVPVGKKPSRFAGKKISADTKALGDSLFGAPSQDSKEQFGRKFGGKIEQANQFIGTLVRDFPEVNSRQMLAEWLSEFFPNARPYSEALFRNLGSAVDVDETGGIDSWGPIYAQLDAPTDTEQTAPDELPPQEDAGSSTGGTGSDAGEGAGTSSANGEDGAKDGGATDPRGTSDGLEPGERPAEDAAGGSGPSGSSGLGRPGDGEQRPGGGDVGTSGAGGADNNSGGSDTSGAQPDAEGNVPVGDGSSQSDPAGSGIPVEDQNHVIADDDVLVPGGDVTKTRANLSAISLLKKLEAENRNPTPEEKKTLAQYVGWGGLPAVFDDVKASRRERKHMLWGEQLTEYENWEKKWGKLYDDVKAALTPQERAAAAASTINAHYTSREAISAMWKMVEWLGFGGGTVLETSAGIGHFIGLQPRALEKRSKWKAVELDSISGRMLTKLYPEAEVQVTGFEKAKIKNHSIDLVVGNVPFAKAGPNDSRYPQFSLHNYFFARAVDALKPGGIIIAISSDSTMDAASSAEARKWLSERANLVGAIRLPNNAFKKNAGTEVTTDIIILQKRDVGSPSGQPWLQTRTVPIAGGAEVVINQYFADNPDMMLGRMSLEGTMYREGQQALVAVPGSDLSADLKAVTEKLPQNIIGELAWAQDDTTTEGELSNAKEGSVEFEGSKPFIVRDGRRTEAPWAKEKKTVEMAKRFVALRDHAKEHIALMQSEDASEAQIEQSRKKLNDLHDAFTQKHGWVSDIDTTPLESDQELYLVLSLEDSVSTPVEYEVKSGKSAGQKRVRIQKSYKKGAMFSKRTLFPSTVPTTAETLDDAVSLSLAYNAKIDVPFIAELLKISEEQATERLDSDPAVLMNPESGTYEASDVYLSGAVRQKLKRAEAMAESEPRYAKNVEALKAVVPEKRTLERITFNPATAWLPPRAHRAFAKDVLGVDLRATFVPETNTWIFETFGGERDTRNTTNFGTTDWTGSQLLEAASNYRQPLVYDEDGDGKKTKNPEKTLAAIEKMKEVQDAFSKWIRGPGRAEFGSAIEEVFNDRFNGMVRYRPKPPKVKHFPGANQEITLRPYQAAVVMRGLRQSLLVAHGVGTGKTFTLITMAMEMRRLGIAKKPMIGVFNATVSQFAASFRRLYPTARILVIGGSTDTKNDSRKDTAAGSDNASARKQMLSRIATGDYDAIIAAHSVLNQIPDDPQREEAYIEAQIQELREAAIAADRGGAKSATVKNIEKLIKALEEKLEMLLDRAKDNTLTFEQLGVDAFLVDEAHAFKKIGFASKMENVKGIDKGASQRALSLHLKGKWVQERSGGRNFILATGTPVSNTMAELWTFMRFVAPQVLEAYGIEHFDAFASTFGKVVTRMEQDAAGGFKLVDRFSRFANGEQLVQMFHAAADVVLLKEADLPGIPALKTGKAQAVTVKMSRSVKRIIAEIRATLDDYAAMSGKEKRENSHIPLTSYTKAKMAAVDGRLIDPDLPDEPDSKANSAVANILRIREASAENLGTQAIFCDSIQSADGRFNIYKEIRRKLIEAGVPESEIAIIQESSKTKKDLVMERVNQGTVRIVMGSTSTLGTGVNIQERLVAAHHLDAPARPSDMEQRNGRIIRQGNSNSEVEILVYGVQGSLDAALFDRLAMKQEFINQILRGEMTADEFDDPADDVSLSYQEQMAIFSGNPLAMMKVTAEADVRRLEAMQASYFSSRDQNKGRLYSAESSLQSHIEAVPKYEAAAAAAKDAWEKPFTATVDGKPFTERATFETALKTVMGTALDEARRDVSAEGHDYAEKYPNKWSYGTKDSTARMIVVRGLRVIFKAEARWESNMGVLTVSNKSFSFSTSIEGQRYDGNFETESGLIASLSKASTHFSGQAESSKNYIEIRRKEVLELKSALEAPFDRQEELIAARARLAEINRKALAESAPVEATVSLKDLVDGMGKSRPPQMSRLRSLADRMRAQIERLAEQEDDSVDKDEAKQYEYRAKAIQERLEKVIASLAQEESAGLKRARDNGELLGAPSENNAPPHAPAPEKEPLPSSQIPKPAPVPDRPGWFFRSEPDSLRALGYSVSRQVYERRPQATANEQALEILSLVDEDKATNLALDPHENGIPGDVKTILYGELMARQAKIVGDPNSSVLQRAKAQRRLQQMDNVKAPQFTEKGQEISALQQVYKNAAGGGIAQYLHHKKKEQEEALGGEKGMADIKAAADELTKVNEQSIEEATRAMNKALRAIPLTKPIWKKYKDWAAQRVFDWLDGITKPPQEMAGLERFTREIVDQVKSRMKEEMGDAAKAQKLPERNPSDILRDAILNKEKYREVFDNVLKKLEAEYGEDHPLVEQAHIALGAMGAKPWSKGILDKVIKQAHEAMGQNVRELAKLHYTNANRLHRDLADALSDIAGIGATTAKELADDLAKRMQELTAEAKKKAILGIVRRNTATPKTREKMTAIERAVLLNNYGALSVPELADVVAKELKLPHISPEQMKEIARIGDRIETATNMADKAKAELDMLRALRIARGISRMDVNTSIWYANMLSGYTTQVANVIGNMMTGTLQLATIMATNPKYAGEALRGWINGFGEGWAQGAAIMKTGRGSREFDANKAGEAGNVLELVDFKRDFPDMNAEWANARQKHTKALRYVTRMMKAVDSVFYYPAREAFARVAVAKLLEGEFKGKDLIDKVRETLAISTEQFHAAQKRAEAEGFEGIDLVLRVSNIIEEARRKTPVGAQAADASEQFALESTFNNEPVGWAGILYQHLVPLTQSIAPGGVPVLRVFLPFLRVPTNLFNASMNYTPVGAVRALRGMPTEAVRGDDGKFSVKRQDFTADERKRLYAQSIGGSLAMAGLAVLAMSGGDDGEEPWFDITSTGPDDYKKRQQLEATGWRPHSIKMGDTWVSYKDSPLLVALAVTGHVVDAVRYGKQDDEVALGSKVANAFLTAPRAIMETSMLSGLGQLMEYASGRASAKQLTSFLTRTATGVAVPNLLQQLDRQFSPEVRESNGPLGTVGAGLPFVRRAGDVKTDVLGEAVERSPLARFGGFETNDPLREVLRDKGVFISTPSRDTKLGNAPMDEETYREYVRISGERIQQRLSQSVRSLQAQSKENVERIVDRITREERERAKNMLRGRAGAN